MALLLLCLAVVSAGLCSSSAAVAAAASYPTMNLPSFSLSNLQAPNAAVLQSVGDAIAHLGMFAVTGFHVNDVAHRALSKFVSCALEGGLDLRQVEMEDGAKRNTLATITNASMPQPLPADVVAHCPDFAVAANELRAAVAATGSAYAGLLDRLLYGDDAARGSPAQCFTDAVREAEGLEHFHLFEPASSPAAEHTLAMHSDIGLFLVMSPAELFDHTAASTAAATADNVTLGRRARDLVVQLPDGRVVAPVLPEGALLVMNGEGLSRWMRPPSAGRPQPYSPLHEVLSSDMGGGVRAWFGRMFMPPHSAVLQEAAAAEVEAEVEGHGVGPNDRDPFMTVARRRSMMTFGEYRQHTYEMFRDGRGHAASTAGCSPARRRLVDESSCGADQVFCWHSCMTITPNNITCNRSDIICADVYTGLRWPQDFPPLTPNSTRPGHCKNCTLTCPAQPPAPSPAPASPPSLPDLPPSAPPSSPARLPPPRIAALASAPPPPPTSSAWALSLGGAAGWAMLGLHFALASVLARAVACW